MFDGDDYDGWLAGCCDASHDTMDEKYRKQVACTGMFIKREKCAIRGEEEGAFFEIKQQQRAAALCEEDDARLLS